MKRISAIRSCLCYTPALSLCALCLLLFSSGAKAESEQPAMVAIGYPTTSEQAVSLTSLRAMFGMIQRKWPTDTPVKVFVLRDQALEHAAFSKSVLQIFPHQLRTAWERQALAGERRYPEEVDSTQEMLSRVASTPGAIGYVNASEVTDAVRVIAVKNVPAFTIGADRAESRRQRRSQATFSPDVATRRLSQPSHDADLGFLAPAQMATPRLPMQGESSQPECQPRQQALPTPRDLEPDLLNQMIDLLQHIVTSTTMLRQHA